jgi:hypothetical protein
LRQRVALVARLARLYVGVVLIDRACECRGHRRQIVGLGYDRMCQQQCDQRIGCGGAVTTLATEKGAWANIPPRSNRNNPICFSPYLYRARNQVERFFNKVKHCGRVAPRYDRLAANDLAFVPLASIRPWLRVNEAAS